MRISSLIPMQPVKNVSVGIAFYEKLGFVVENRHAEWGWVILRCGDCRLMLDESINVAAGARRAAVLYLYPEDIVDFHRAAKENGLPVPDLGVTFYGMNEFRMEDPDGNRLWMGQADGRSDA
ncbi:MAG: VOC family protein [Rhodanobacter sp.]